MLWCYCMWIGSRSLVGKPVLQFQSGNTLADFTVCWASMLFVSEQKINNIAADFPPLNFCVLQASGSIISTLWVGIWGQRKFMHLKSIGINSEVLFLSYKGGFSFKNIFAYKMFIAALFKRAKMWMQSKYPSTNECINKMWHIHIVKYWKKWKSFSHFRLFATPWAIQSMEFSRPGHWSR